MHVSCFLMELKLSHSVLLLLGLPVAHLIHSRVNLRCKGSPGDTAVGNHKRALATSADTQENLQSKSKSCGFLCSPKGSGLCVKPMERVPPLLSEQALVQQVLSLNVLICWSSARHK